MCDKQERMAVVGRSAGRKAQREHDAKVAADAVRSYVNGQARPAGKTSLTPTQYAERVPMVVGGIVLLAAMNWLLHALLYSLAAVFTVVCGCSVVPGCPAQAGSEEGAYPRAPAAGEAAHHGRRSDRPPDRRPGHQRQGYQEGGRQPSAGPVTPTSGRSRHALRTDEHAVIFASRAHNQARERESLTVMASYWNLELDIPCGQCFKRIDGERIYLLCDRRMVHFRCILKYGLDPYSWIHAHGSQQTILTHLMDHPFGYEYPLDDPSAERPPLEADPSMGEGI